MDSKYLSLADGKTITPQQVEGVEFLINRVRAILAFQTGLGKTVTSLTALKILLEKYGRARGVIICPVKAVKIFKKELMTKLGYKSHEVGILTNQELNFDINKNKIFILTNTALEKYYPMLIELHMELHQNNKLILIVDEAHQLQNKKSGFYILMKELKPLFTAIWFSTATPILNDLDSLYNIVTFLEENFFGTKTLFLNRYTKSKLKNIFIAGGGGKKKKVRVILGYQNLDDLKKRMESICIMRQQKYNLKFASVTSPLTPNELLTYERVSEGIFGDEKRNFSQRMHDLQRLVDNSYTDELIGIRDSTKEKLLVKSLKSIISKGLSVIVYADYLATIDRIISIMELNKTEIGYREIFQIKGSVKIQEREAIEDKIRTKDIIIVTRAGTESINLQKANCIIMYDIPYSIKDCIQLIGRITRMDTEFNSQYIILIWTQGTIDEYKYLLFQDNATLIKQILGSDANLPTSLAELDKKTMDKLRDKLLWHYKDSSKQEIILRKKTLKTHLIATTKPDMGNYLATYFINLNPLSQSIDGTKRMSAITPLEKDYLDYFSGSLPYTILKNRYIDTLKSDKGKIVLGTLVDAILNKKSLIVLVDNYGIGGILKNYILENVKL
jgi:ERCC4-related helicase